MWHLAEGLKQEAPSLRVMRDQVPEIHKQVLVSRTCILSLQSAGRQCAHTKVSFPFLKTFSCKVTLFCSSLGLREWQDWLVNVFMTRDQNYSQARAGLETVHLPDGGNHLCWGSTQGQKESLGRTATPEWWHISTNFSKRRCTVRLTA